MTTQLTPAGASPSSRLAEVFVELADTLVDEFDVVDLLQTLAERCVELLEIAAAGLVLSDPRGELRLMAWTGVHGHQTELFDESEAPARDCFSTGRAVVNVPAAEAATRWPRFSAAAAAAGYAGAHALPMRLRGNVIGVLSLLTGPTAVLSGSDVAIAQAMADVATIGLIHERSLHEQTLLSEQLLSALDARVVVEQATGVNSARNGIGVDEAFRELRRSARERGMPLTAVAEEILADLERGSG